MKKIYEELGLEILIYKLEFQHPISRMFSSFHYEMLCREQVKFCFYIFPGFTPGATCCRSLGALIFFLQWFCRNFFFKIIQQKFFLLLKNDSVDNDSVDKIFLKIILLSIILQTSFFIFLVVQVQPLPTFGTFCIWIHHLGNHRAFLNSKTRSDFID